MHYRTLGNSALNVSQLCLGTMTFGEQNTVADAAAQLDYALANGINFVDTAEMYPVPPKAETQGKTEEYIGQWLQRSGKRADIILASKAAGPGDWMQYLRGGPRLNTSHLRRALEGSLQRLHTDYIDLYQLHWPDRNTNFFGKLGYQHNAEEQQTPLLETIECLQAFIKEGKIRHWGFSNETPWGVMKGMAICDAQGFARPVSIQNPYNLLNRSYEVGMAEISHRENIGLLAYSPMAFGVLSGKYLHGQRPANGRLTLFSRFSRYTNEQASAAAEEYCTIAREHGLSPAQMALAFVNQQAFVTSNIIGATNMAQLQENINSLTVDLSPELLEKINDVQRRYPNPAP